MLFRKGAAIGGFDEKDLWETGWYFADRLWRLRGLVDLLVGGVGVRRGRRDPETPTVGSVLDFWRGWFAKNADAAFDAEDIIVCDNRAVVRWIYRKLRDGQPWHIRGVDVFTVRGGRVAAKLSYVKG